MASEADTVAVPFEALRDEEKGLHIAVCPHNLFPWPPPTPTSAAAGSSGGEPPKGARNISAVPQHKSCIITRRQMVIGGAGSKRPSEVFGSPPELAEDIHDDILAHGEKMTRLAHLNIYNIKDCNVYDIDVYIYWI